MGTAEQTGNLKSRVKVPSERKFAKRWLHRVWRRASKRDPENAPKRRPTRGWAD